MQTALSALALAATLITQPASDWELVAFSTTGQRTIDLESGAIGESEPVEGEAGVSWSPDRSMMARLALNPRSRMSELEIQSAYGDVLGSARGRKIRELTWSPTGDLLFVMGTMDETQVYAITPTERPSTRARARRISGGETQSWRPSVSSDGRIAYLELREREGKAQYSDLIVLDGDDRRVIVKRTDIGGIAWSPDGESIAYDTFSGVMVHHLERGTTLRFGHDSIDKRLYAHRAYDIAWRPDGGALACTLRFAGGRSVMAGQEATPIFGDREVFVIPLEGEPKVFSLPDDVHRVDWSE